MYGVKLMDNEIYFEDAMQHRLRKISILMMNEVLS